MLSSPLQEEVEEEEDEEEGTVEAPRRQRCAPPRATRRGAVQIAQTHSNPSSPLKPAQTTRSIDA
jgi:hypothetical protein